MIQNINLAQTIATWQPIANTVYVPHSDEQYDRLVALLDNLIDQVGEDEEHPLASMMDVIGALIENYETKYVPVLDEVA